MTKIPTDLPRSLNKSISQLCPFSIGKINNQNHCAHYVSHMMGYEFSGPTCKNFTWADKQQPAKGATIRVDDVFKSCKLTGLLSAKPASVTECLVFVTLSSNVKKVGDRLFMGNNPRKHIGILQKGKVWNYSNSNNKVVSDLQAAFITKFTRAYKKTGTTVEFYYGTFV
ncbi:MAG: hypothetical protein COA42_15150 [Alteromonadaceae bacterium]|nr:MAG: hypothetical protein COA42_15150 [Alteromonadaceae bacterium]